MGLQGVTDQKCALGIAWSGPSEVKKGSAITWQVMKVAVCIGHSQVHFSVNEVPRDLSLGQHQPMPFVISSQQQTWTGSQVRVMPEQLDNLRVSVKLATHVMRSVCDLQEQIVKLDKPPRCLPKQVCHLVLSADHQGKVSSRWMLHNP